MEVTTNGSNGSGAAYTSVPTDYNELISISKIWDGILFLSISGFLDSTKAESLITKSLEEIQRTDSPFMIVDISSVYAIDSSVAKHIFDLNKAASLMGCECVISGFNATVAHSLVSMNVDFSAMKTRTTIQQALRYCLNQNGYEIKEAVTLQ
ncbi:MAG: hypothetical protein CME62_06845 [Halobacteriovoraceae bacterium]|nr:hypothetical protein [Halobacteriovoraceae bacterium]|tara:strand:+ start:4826 stop:5281 length:456 start_codon:yes stop_codon:yes gene_type:complete